MVTGHVVMATKRTDVVVVGRPTLRVGLSVIEVAAMCRLATTREHTSRIVSPDPPFLRFCRAPTQGSGGYYPAVVGDLVDPFAIDVLHGCLSGDLGSPPGRNRPVLRDDRPDTPTWPPGSSRLHDRRHRW